MALWTIPPSIILCIVALALFGLSTIWHFYLVRKHRLLIWIAFVVGGVFQVIGYIGRIVCTHELTKLGPYIVQSLFILLAPILYAASIYSLLEKLITVVPVKMPIASTKITKIFVTVDVLSFFLQAAGAGSQAVQSETALVAGRDVVLFSLSIQLVFFLYFVSLVFLFDLRTRGRKHRPTILIKVLELSCFLLITRSVYRICEFAEGYSGYIMIHEVFFYIFDALMMFSIQIIYNINHPGPALARASQGEANERNEIRNIPEREIQNLQGIVKVKQVSPGLGEKNSPGSAEKSYIECGDKSSLGIREQNSPSL